MGEVVIIVFWSFVLLILIFQIGGSLKESRTAKKKSSKAVYDKYEQLLNSSNAEILAYCFGQKESKKRYIKRKKKLRKEGIRENIYSGSGYIYIAGCAPKETVWDNFKFNYVYFFCNHFMVKYVKVQVIKYIIKLIAETAKVAPQRFFLATR